MQELPIFESGYLSPTEKGDFIFEIKGDLFENHGCDALCHCVSADLVMGKGIATIFKERFGSVDYLKSQKRQIGQVAALKCEDISVYYLITKQKYYEKPTLEALKLSLIDMKNLAIKTQIKSIGMPRIGCGLDQLKWENVKNIIKETFQDCGIIVKVYYL